MSQDQLLNYVSEKMSISFGEPLSELTWDVSKWNDPLKTKSDLVEIQALQKAPKQDVTGSLVMKRLAFVFTGALMAYYYEGKVWILPSSTIKFGFDEDSKFNLSLYVSKIDEKRNSSEVNWDDVVKSNFHEWLRPLIETIEHTNKVHQIILWENVFIYLKWFYEVLAPSLPDLPQNDWKSHWQQITENSFFGDDVLNPFAYLNKTKAKRQMDNGKRVRHTCCYKHKLPNGKKCSTCSQIRP